MSYESIELCAGCGGLALGLEEAGFKHKLIVEIDKNACKTLTKNKPDWNIIQDDIKNLQFEEKYKNIDLISGGIPCQSYSYAGKKKGLDDPKGKVFFSFKTYVKNIFRNYKTRFKNNYDYLLIIVLLQIVVARLPFSCYCLLRYY